MLGLNTDIENDTCEHNSILATTERIFQEVEGKIEATSDYTRISEYLENRAGVGALKFNEDYSSSEFENSCDSDSSSDSDTSSSSDSDKGKIN